MAQYIDGTVTLTSGSATVVGGSTDFWTASNVQVGDLFKKYNENAFYSVTGVTSATNFTISPVYAGNNASSVDYLITRDFTTNLNMPEMSFGDLDFQDIYTRAIRIIDTQFFEVEVATPNANATVLATQTVVLGSGNTTLALPLASNRYKFYFGKRDPSGTTLKMLASSPPDYIASGPSLEASVTLATKYGTVTLIGDGGNIYYKF